MLRATVNVLLLIVSISIFSSVHAANNKVVMVFGDSLSAGYGLNVGEGWVQLLRNKLKNEHQDISIVNASISGNTSGNGLSRISADLKRHQPDVLVLELGGNDGLRGHSPLLFKSNMQKIIDRSLNQGVKVLILGMKLPTNYSLRYRTAFEKVYTELANENQLPLVAFFMDKVALDPSLMQKDGIHPNKKGQPQLLDNIWPALKPLIN